MSKYCYLSKKKKEYLHHLKSERMRVFLNSCECHLYRAEKVMVLELILEVLYINLFVCRIRCHDHILQADFGLSVIF